MFPAASFQLTSFTPEPAGDLQVSVVLPVFNEAACVAATLAELCEVLERLPMASEVVAVDDGSTDATPAILARCRLEHPRLRVIRLAANAGQSAAFGAGFRSARGAITVMMDADGQNDPEDIPALLHALQTADAACGYRITREDAWSKRAGSRVANAVRRRLLHDGVRDTGCSLKAAPTALLRALPMQMAGMHRFIPALLQLEGARVAEVPVRHRPRRGGRSKYGNLRRLFTTIPDLGGVIWMRSRHRHVAAVELHDHRRCPVPAAHAS